MGATRNDAFMASEAVKPGGVRVLRNAHVIDPAQGIDCVTDVAIADGRILSVGEDAARLDVEALDLTGLYLSPGWIDLHVHAYGTLGFADPDSIGVYQGVTSFVEAGGPGIDTIDEFAALLPDRLVTGLYAGPYIRPIGIVGLNFIEDDVRTLNSIAVTRWMDWVQDHPGLVRYIKVGAFGNIGSGPLKLGKGLAEILSLPLYVHIGEYETRPNQPVTTEDAFKVVEAGDIVTHVYHGNLGQILDERGRVQPFVRDAARRGALFDIGFGGYNFAWSVAEKAFAQDLRPHIISSDLQQFNVMGPVFSLANVMSVMLRLGMSLNEVITAVTERPAKALSLDDRAGSLKPGLPADITIFRKETGEFDLADCYTQTRKADTRLVPVMAFKAGQRIDCDLPRAQDERNWFMQIVEDRVPSAVDRLKPRQLEFLAALKKILAAIDWEIYAAKRLNLDKAVELQGAVHRALVACPLPLGEALHAIYDCFIENPFTMQIGLFLVRLERSFALKRFDEVLSRRPLAA